MGKKTYRKKVTTITVPRDRFPKRSFVAQANGVHKFVRTASLAPIQFDTVISNIILGYVFQLTDLPNRSEFQNLFEYYRFTKIQITFTPTWNNTDIPFTGSAPIRPSIATVIDNDSGSPPVSHDELRQYSSYKITYGPRSQTRTIKPKLLKLAYATPITNGYAPGTAWVRTEDETVDWYGLRGIANNGSVSSSGNPWSFEVRAKYFIECKGLK